MPAAKFFPVGPRMTTRPPVMYSQPWSPTPSATAAAPELRTQNRSPAIAVDERLAGGGAVQGHVAHDDVLAGIEGAALGRIEDQLAAGEALAEPVVAVPLQLQRQPLGEKGAEGLPPAAVAGDDIAVVRQGIAARRVTSEPNRVPKARSVEETASSSLPERFPFRVLPSFASRTLSSSVRSRWKS